MSPWQFYSLERINVNTLISHWEIGVWASPQQWRGKEMNLKALKKERPTYCAFKKRILVSGFTIDWGHDYSID